MIAFVPREKKAEDISWNLLLGVTAAFVCPLLLLCHIVIYTEGEIMQGLFGLLIVLFLPCLLVGIYRRRVALWCVAVFGGLLLTWQACQVRKWAMIHEDIVSLVRFAEEQKAKTGNYSLTGYQFRRPWVEKHICAIQFDETNGWRVHYFMNDAGITYWYSSKTGFGYYPD